MDVLIKEWTVLFAIGIEAAAGIIIAVAAGRAFVASLPLLLVRKVDPAEHIKGEIRLRLGRWLALALEFEVAADILRTAVAPTWNEIGQLGAIVVLRTVLNYFLQREIDEAVERGEQRLPERAARQEAG